MTSGRSGRSGRGGVIFDVDGTLLETNYLHIAAWWEAFRERGYDVRCADIHRALGLGSDELVERVLGRPEPSVIDAHSRYFAPYLGRMRPLPGAADLLAATSRRGLNVVLATSAKDEEIDFMLDALGARDAVGTVVSSGSVGRAKPAPDIVEVALTESRTDRRRAVMVGDAVWDVIAAARAGIPCVGLLSGGIAEQELRDAGAVEAYHDAAALLGNLESSAIGRLDGAGPTGGPTGHAAAHRG
jgi:HAD superfamily hydrolase (TIGR01509 family)